MPTDTEYLEAQKHVRARRGLYVHALVYLVVNAALFTLDALTPGGWWFYWPLIGWGIGLTINAVVVLGEETLFGAAWERRAVEQYVKRHPSG